MHIGVKIKNLRKNRSITQEQLAQYLNISTQTVSEWEKGKAVPDKSLVPQLISFFELSEEELFSPDENMTDKYVLLHATRLTYGI